LFEKFLFLFILISLLNACSSDQTNNDISGVVANILITEKGGDENTGYWIVGDHSENKVKVFIDDKSKWDRFAIDHMYTVHYGEKRNGDAVLYESDLIR